MIGVDSGNFSSFMVAILTYDSLFALDLLLLLLLLLVASELNVAIKLLHFLEEQREKKFISCASCSAKYTSWKQFHTDSDLSKSLAY